MKHTDWVRSLPCLICNDPTSTELCHLRYSDYKSGKNNPGMGARPSDIWTWPGCHYHHDMQHQIGEKAFWNNFKIDPITYCLLLHQFTGQINMVPDIIEKAKKSWKEKNTSVLERTTLQRSIHKHKEWVGS